MLAHPTLSGGSKLTTLPLFAMAAGAARKDGAAHAGALASARVAP